MENITVESHNASRWESDPAPPGTYSAYDSGGWLLFGTRVDTLQ